MYTLIHQKKSVNNQKHCNKFFFLLKNSKKACDLGRVIAPLMSRRYLSHLLSNCAANDCGGMVSHQYYQVVLIITSLRWHQTVTFTCTRQVTEVHPPPIIRVMWYRIARENRMYSYSRWFVFMVSHYPVLQIQVNFILILLNFGLEIDISSHLRYFCVWIRSRRTFSCFILKLNNIALFEYRMYCLCFMW